MFLLHAPLERWVFLLILSVYPYDLLSQVVNLRLGTTNQNLFYQYVKEQTPLCGWESNPQPWLYKNPALTVELPHSDCLTLQIYNFYPNQQVFNQFFFEASARFELANKSFADSPLKPLGYRTLFICRFTRTRTWTDCLEGSSSIPWTMNPWCPRQDSNLWLPH